MRFNPSSRTLIAACLLSVGLIAQPAAPANGTPHLFFRVVLGGNFTEPQSGRLLLFIAKGHSAKSVDTNPFAPQAVSVAAKEVSDLAPGGAVEVDTDDIAFPAGFSHLAPGSYSAQAVLDLRHEYNYVGRAPGDPISEVTPITRFDPGAMSEPVLTLNLPVPNFAYEGQGTPRNAINLEDFVSPALSRFWGRPVHMRCWVVEPPGYKSHPNARYPAVYFTHGFGGNLDRIRPTAEEVYRRMTDKRMPEMVWILLDESLPTGTHEFADSVNNGPWGKALTTELIPHLESRYHLGLCAGIWLERRFHGNLVGQADSFAGAALGLCPKPRGGYPGDPAPFPFWSIFQNGPRRQGFASPRKTGAPLTAPGRSEQRT